MMIEGTVDVSGSTVKIDNSQELGNLYILARRAKDNNNKEDAVKYYNMILIKDPNSWEAAFYTVFFKASDCNIDDIQFAANSVENCIDTVLTLIKDNVESRNEKIKAVNEVASLCMSISNTLYSVTMNHYNLMDMNVKSNYTQEMVNNCCAARDILYTLGDKISLMFDEYDELHVCCINAWAGGIHKHNNLMNNLLNKQLNKYRYRCVRFV